MHPNRSLIVNNDISFESQDTKSANKFPTRSQTSLGGSVLSTRANEQFKKYIQQVNLINEQEYQKLNKHKRQYNQFIR